MAVRGAPVAHEDDAERAVRAGLAILDAIADLNEAEPPSPLATPRSPSGSSTGLSPTTHSTSTRFAPPAPTPSAPTPCSARVAACAASAGLKPVPLREARD